MVSAVCRRHSTYTRESLGRGVWHLLSYSQQARTLRVHARMHAHAFPVRAVRKGGQNNPLTTSGSVKSSGIVGGHACIDATMVLSVVFSRGEAGEEDEEEEVESNIRQIAPYPLHGRTQVFDVLALDNFLNNEAFFLFLPLRQREDSAGSRATEVVL